MISQYKLAVDLPGGHELPEAGMSMISVDGREGGGVGKGKKAESLE